MFSHGPDPADKCHVSMFPCDAAIEWAGACGWCVWLLPHCPGVTLLTDTGPDNQSPG